MQSIGEQMRQMKNQAELFEQSGGDAALFWADRMAVYGRKVCDSRLSDCGYKAILLDRIINEYDKVIMSRSSIKDIEEALSLTVDK